MVDVLRTYAGRVQEVAEDLLAAGRHNRESLAAIVGLEVDRALERVGLATADELRELTDRVRELEATVRDLKDDLAIQQQKLNASSQQRSPETGQQEHGPKPAKRAARDGAKGPAGKRAKAGSTDQPAGGDGT